MNETKKMYYFYLLEKVFRQRLIDKVETFDEYNIRVNYLKEKLNLLYL